LADLRNQFAIVRREPVLERSAAGKRGEPMRWTLTIKDQTYGTGTEIPKYACRVTRTGNTIRLSVENLGSGAVREGRFLMPRSMAKLLGDALHLAAGDVDSMDVVFSLDEAKGKKS